MMPRHAIGLFFAGFAYLAAAAASGYMVLFLAGRFVPRTIDSGPEAPASLAAMIDGALLLVFGVQHSVMAREKFKSVWTEIVPEHLERSVYVLASAIALALVCMLWHPIPYRIWAFDSEAARLVLRGCFWFGGAVALVSSFLVDHFSLMGLRQVWCRFRNREYFPPEFQTPGLYRFLRHPMMLGLLVLFWSTPVMTAGHLIFSAGMTIYIMIGIHLEENSLLEHFGERYRRYRQSVPMLFPRLTPYREAGRHA